MHTESQSSLTNGRAGSATAMSTESPAIVDSTLMTVRILRQPSPACTRSGLRLASREIAEVVSPKLQRRTDYARARDLSSIG